MLNFFISFAFFEFGALCGFFVAALMQAARMVVKLQEEIEQKTFNIMISTTKLSARTVLRAVKAAFRLYQSKRPKASRASELCCGKTGACPAWRSARPASVGWNAMPKSTASTMPSARTPPRCRPGIWSFSKPRTQKLSLGVQGVFGIFAQQGQTPLGAGKTA